MSGKQRVREFILMTLGTAVVAVGVYFFKFPNNFSTGGVSGLGVVLGALIPTITPGTIIAVINVLFLIAGFFVLNKGFGIRTVYCSLLFSGILQLLEIFAPMTAPLTNQPMLELFFAVILPSLGSAVLFNMEASTGGTDIAAMIVKKYTAMDTGMAL
ncbi:MAG: YitT family protein, partial [Oscillospiraceae bacterium]